MTRWARGGDANRKKPHEPTPWSQMTQQSQGSKANVKSQGSKSGDNAKGSNSEDKGQELKSVVKGDDSSFKQKLKLQDKSRKSTTVVPKLTARKVKDGELKGFASGLAAELEKLKQEASDLNEEEEKEINEVVKKVERTEQRRLKRKVTRETEKICFNCREPGHDMASCPKTTGRPEAAAAGICFKCGSTEHSIQRCRLKLPPGEFPYAKCFVCGEMGHLSKQCSDNPRGLYPKGGCCKECGSVEHFRRDCPELQKTQGFVEVKLHAAYGRPTTSVEEHADWTEDDLAPAPPRKKKPKVVKF